MWSQLQGHRGRPWPPSQLGGSSRRQARSALRLLSDGSGRLLGRQLSLLASARVHHLHSHVASSAECGAGLMQVDSTRPIPSYRLNNQSMHIVDHGKVGQQWIKNRLAAIACYLLRCYVLHAKAVLGRGFNHACADAWLNSEMHPHCTWRMCA